MSLQEDLRSARERLERVGNKARDRFVALRAEQARTNAILFEAEHGLRVAAVELQRSTRARHLMARETGVVVGKLVAYEEPRATSVGRVAPESGIRWRLLEGKVLR